MAFEARQEGKRGIAQVNDPLARGVLTFKPLDFSLFDPTHALYIGEYLLTYPDRKTATESTSPIIVKEAGAWKITVDHSR